MNQRIAKKIRKRNNFRTWKAYRQHLEDYYAFRRGIIDFAHSLTDYFERFPKLRLEIPFRGDRKGE